MADYFHKSEKVFWDRLRLNVNLITGTKISNQPFITKLGICIPSSPTDVFGRSHFIALWTSEFEIGAEDKTFVDSLIKGKVPEQEIL
jgi:hypothetical protein